MDPIKNLSSKSKASPQPTKQSNHEPIISAKEDNKKGDSNRSMTTATNS